MPTTELEQPRGHSLTVGAGRPRWQFPLLAALVAFVVGVPSTAAGAGLAIRHLQKNGLTGTSIVGLALLAVGLVLLGYAAVVSWRATRGWRRLWFIPATVITLLVIWPITMAVMLTSVPRTALGPVTPADRGLAYSDVAFRTGDGVRLSAWLVPSHNHAMVVLLHGAGENRTATLPQAVVLARHGFGLLMVDARGQGRSGGEGMDAGWWGDEDVTAAVSFLTTQPGIAPDRIAVLGLSMGGEEAIGAAATDPRIAAVVAEGATNRTAADKAGWLPHGIAGTIQRGIDRLTYGVTALLTSAPQPRPLHDAIAAASTTPFLLIAAGTVRDEQNAAAYFAEAAPDRVRIWVAPDATHTHALQADPDRWETQVTGFLDHALHITDHPTSPR